MWEKYLTANQFEAMVYELAEANPDMSLGQCAIVLYRTQEERNQAAKAESIKQIKQLQKKALKIRENLGCKN